MQGSDPIDDEAEGRRHMLPGSRSGVRETEQPDGLPPAMGTPGSGLHQHAAPDGKAGRSRNTDELETAQSMQLRQK